MTCLEFGEVVLYDKSSRIFKGDYVDFVYEYIRWVILLFVFELVVR